MEPLAGTANSEMVPLSLPPVPNENELAVIAKGEVCCELSIFAICDEGQLSCDVSPALARAGSGKGGVAGLLVGIEDEAGGESLAGGAGGQARVTAARCCS